MINSLLGLLQIRLYRDLINMLGTLKASNLSPRDKDTSSSSFFSLLEVYSASAKSEVILFDILCRYCSISGITWYSIDFLTYLVTNEWRISYLLSLVFILCRHYLAQLLFTSTRMSQSLPVLILRDSYDDLIVDFWGEAAFDVHKSLEEHLLSKEVPLLFLMLLLKHVYLLRGIKRLSGFKVYLSWQSEQQVIKVVHLLRGSAVADSLCIYRQRSTLSNRSCRW